jgi:hypothetical protein
VHQQVDVVMLAVELAQLGTEVGAHVSHDLLAAFQDLVGEHSTPILGYEDQVRV